MGYYLDFVFDTNSVSTWQQVVRRLEEAGASIVLIDPATPRADDFVELSHPKIPYLISIRKSKPDNFKGNWADIRLSWGQKTKKLREMLMVILDLADSIGSRVYDGQIQKYIGRDTLEETIISFKKISENVFGMFGRTEYDNTLPKNDWLLRQIEEARQENAEELDLRFLNIDNLPPEIGQLTELIVLRLGGNELSSLPHDIGQLKKLIYLSLMGNQFTLIPKEIFELHGMIELGLAQNKITVLDPAFAQLTALEWLDLGGNKLTSLCPEICQLTHLHGLDLRANLLRIFPTDFGELQSLKILKLSRNRLNVVPSQICQLKDLTNLHLDGNNLSTLPPEIGNLIHLEKLSLHLNPLTSLPREICNLVSLQRITLPKFGMFLDIPAEIDLSNPQEIFRYIFSII
jgi:hypothetical protein